MSSGKNPAEFVAATQIPLRSSNLSSSSYQIRIGPGASCHFPEDVQDLLMLFAGFLMTHQFVGLGPNIISISSHCNMPYITSTTVSSGSGLGSGGC